MQSFLAKCAALGIVAGGFTLTGDAGRLVDRGRRLLEARTVPAETPADEAASGNPAPARAASSEAPTGPASRSQPAGLPQTAGPSQPMGEPAAAAQASAPAAPALPSVPLLDAPVGRAVEVPAPPSKGPDAVDLRQVPPGSRMLFWVRRSGAVSRARSIDLIALDLIDPNTGEALEHRHAAIARGNEPTHVHAAPRRVVITRDATGRIAKGDMLRVTPVHGVVGLGREEAIGTVVAVDIQTR